MSLSRTVLLLPLLSLLLSSCAGPAFHRAWREAGNQPAEGVVGRWEGTWTSEANSHHGKLRCVVSAPGKPGEPHQFYYRATWMGVLSGSYRAPHQVKADGKERWTFSGEHKMPDWAGGLYRYEGTIEGDQFQADYRCRLDHGSYKLTRVPSKK